MYSSDKGFSAIEVLVGIVVLAIVGGAWVLLPDSSQTAVVPSPTKVLTNPSTQEAVYRGGLYSHMATNLYFEFEYPTGWHVQYHFRQRDGGIQNLLTMDPEPITTSDKSLAITGYQIVLESDKPPTDSMQNKQTENFNLRNVTGSCYSYDFENAMAGSTQKQTQCLIIFSDGIQMQFYLNDNKYYREFKHFIESIYDIS